MELPHDEIPALTTWAGPVGVEIGPEDRASVLVVDDNPVLLDSIAGVVRDLGVETVTATSGRAALRLLLQRDFAVILLDVRMPVMDGFETAQLIRSRPRTAQTPIIFMTSAEARDEELLRAYEIGGADFIHSPIAASILRAKVRVFVELHQLNRLLRRQSDALEARTREIAVKNLQLEEASRLKSDFLANMSHELRTPLNAISGFCEVLRDGLAGELTAKQTDYVNEIFVAGEHLLSLINDILDLSKVESGGMELDLDRVSPATLLASSLSMIKEKAVSHRIVLSLDADAAPGEMLADARKLKQIVFNLLSNALKFTGDGGKIALTGRRMKRADIAVDAPAGHAVRFLPAPEGEFDDFLAITVCDSGIGISEADLGRLFETFVQLDSSLARRYEGTGLGLALVRRLVALHGGAVGVSSLPGEGSCFRVWLPWRDSEKATPASPVPSEAASPVPDEAASVAGDAEPVLAAGTEPTGPLVLIAEDSAQTAALFTSFLRSAGFRTMLANDGEECLALARKLHPDAISLDILMPRLDGWVTLERLKADPELANIPVVMVSVLDDREHGLALGAANVMQKPVRRGDLLGAMAKFGLPGKRRRKCVILMIDDDPKAFAVVAGQLSDPRYRLIRASNGTEGLAKAQQSPPDMILLDLMMPGMSGFEVLKHLRSDARTSKTPVLVLTAKQLTVEDRVRLNGDVLAVVEKHSFSADSLVSEVERTLALHRGGGA